MEKLTTLNITSTLKLVEQPLLSTKQLPITTNTLVSDSPDNPENQADLISISPLDLDVRLQLDDLVTETVFVLQEDVGAKEQSSTKLDILLVSSTNNRDPIVIITSPFALRTSSKETNTTSTK